MRPKPPERMPTTVREAERLAEYNVLMDLLEQWAEHHRKCIDDTEGDRRMLRAWDAYTRED